MSKEKSPDNLNDCPTCGEPIPEDAPQSLCPKCVLGAVAKPTESAPPSISFPQFEAPEIEEVAAAFPTLEIVELIGRGGMGAVYKARQPHLDREVALKILPHSLAETPEFTERFSREGRLLARLNHPNIVGVHDFGESGGYFFLMMEMVDGVNLRQAMRAGKFTPEQALDIVPKVCEALQFAHDEGILHRDIKPENILLDTKGRVKIADFGIAKMVGDVGSPTLTRSGSPGTPQYMAPEQIEHPGEVDHRADIYSLGVVFYEMLTGELPIGRFAAPSKKAAVGSDVDAIVFRSLEKERDRRQQSANEVNTEISSVPRQPDVSPPRFGDASTASKLQSDDPKNRPALAFILTFSGIIFLIILLFASVAMINQSRMRDAVRLQSERIVSTRTSQMTYDLKNEISLMVRQGAPLEEIEKLKQDLTTAEKQGEQLKSPRKNSVVMDEIQFLPLLISAFVILPLCIIPSTIFGWMQLRRQRILGLNSGRTALIIAAWFWPMLAVIGIIFFLMLLPILQGPSWMEGAAISLSLIASIAAGVSLIRRTLKWLNTPVSPTDRANFVDSERSRSSNPPLKQRRLLYFFTLASAILIALLIGGGTVSQSIYSARGGQPDSSLIPSIIVGGIILVIFSIAYYLLINLTYLPKTEPPHSNYNPWPKRVFWLVMTIFLGPTLLIGFSLLVPEMAYRSLGDSTRISANHAVSVIRTTTSNRRVEVQFEFVNQTDEILNADVVFQGPALSEAPDLPDGLGPTETRRVELLPGNTDIEVAFDFPDSHIAKIASSEVHKLFNRQVYFENLSVLPLFRVESKPEKFRAAIHFSSAE